MKKVSQKLIVLLLSVCGVVLIGSFFSKKYFETQLNQKIRISEAFEAVDPEDILGKHKGSILYVDHSSVNCGPCFEEMRDFVPSLQKRYENKPITFVYICSESNFPLKTISNSVLWREKLARLNPGGYHYLVKNELSMKLLEKTVDEKSGEMPYYPWQFIVDESGKIINRHAVRPSDSTKLYQQLDSLLATRKKDAINSYSHR
jgi:hypothetical protein